MPRAAERRSSRRAPALPLPLLDVVTIDAGPVAPATDAERAATMAALRYRLRLHASVAAATVLVESNVTHAGEPIAC